MIFHGGQPTGSKKSGMARQYKQGTSYDAYQGADAVESVTDAARATGTAVQEGEFEMSGQAARATGAAVQECDKVRRVWTP